MRIFGIKGALGKDDDTFTFTNPTPIIQTYGFLANLWVYAAFPDLRRSEVAIPIGKSRNSYFELLNDKTVNPKLIKAIRIITDNMDQMAKGFNWQSRDSNGEVEAITEFPINMLSPMQFQSRVIDLGYERGITVTQNEFFTYDILPFTAVTLTFRYKDHKLSNLLKEKI